MSRCIDAEHFDERVRLAVGIEGAEMTDDFKDGIQATLMLLKTEPTADVVEVVHGKWIISDMGFPYCSKCGTALTKFAPRTNYCSNCGARMDGAE